MPFALGFPASSGIADLPICPSKHESGWVGSELTKNHGPAFGVSDHPSLSGLAARRSRVKAKPSAPKGAALTRPLGASLFGPRRTASENHGRDPALDARL
jgi:hypothetical protein